MADGAASPKSSAPRLDVKEFRRRFKAAWSIAEQWRSLLQDAFDYAMPNRSGFSSNTPGAKKVDKVFDSTGVMGAYSGANRIKADLMPAFKKFIKFVPGPLVPEHLKEGLALKLDEITDTMFAYVHASNFDTSSTETLLDLMVGTGCLLCLEGDELGPLNYVPVSISEVALEAGPWGGVSGVYRKHKVAIRNIKRQWRDAKNLPPEWEDAVRKDPNAEVELEEGTYYSKAEDGSAATAWHYDVIATGQDERRIVERTYDLNPWVTPRWFKLPGEVFGRGPVIMAMPDIKTLNKIVEFVLRNAAMAIAGVYTGVDDGVLNPNTATMTPGSIIPVASNGGVRGPSLAPLNSGGKFDIAALEVNDLRMQVQRQLFDRQLPPDAGAVRSATEIMERIKELARDVGSPFGRLYTELIIPWAQNTVHILARRGVIPPMKVDGLGVSVQVVSPLAQEQNFADVEIVVRWLSILGALGQELVMLTAKTEDLGQWIGEKLGVPNKLIRTENDRKSLMNDIKDAAAEKVAQQGGTNVVPIGAGIAPQSIQTAGAAAGVSPFNRLAA